MINPKWLDSIPDDIVDLWSEAEETALADAARMIRKYGAIPTSLGEMQTLRASGNAQKEINAALAPLVGKSEKAVASIIQKAGNAVVKGDSEFYKMADIYRTTDVDREALNMVLRQGTQSTLQNLRQIIRATAQNGSQQVYDAIDKAQLMVSSGLFSSDQAVRDAVKTLADHGLDSITYTDGHGHVTQKVSIETAVRRAVQTGTNQTSLKISEELADEVGCDLVEVSAHQGARPSHAVWQGKIYSRSGKSDKYPKLSTATGYGTITGLGGVNCRHTFGPWVEGCSRTWNDDELEDLQKPSVTYNGKKLTEYEASQIQRKNERTIRKWKREKSMCEAAGLDTTEADMKIKEWQATQKDFIKQTGFKRDYAREQIYISNASDVINQQAVGSSLNDIIKTGERRIKSKIASIYDELNEYSSSTQEILGELEQLGVNRFKFSDLPKKRTTREIVDAVSVLDNTGGSCASAALAYIGQKSGWNVLDFRGGESHNYFTVYTNISKLCDIRGFKSYQIEAENNVLAAMQVLYRVEEGKTYFMVSAGHAAIVRKVNGKFQHLELQNTVNNGWLPFSDDIISTLHERFYCFENQKNLTDTANALMIDVDSMVGNEELKVILEYINSNGV